MSSSAERQEERIRLGLIAYVSQHTVDPDYAALRARRRGSRPPRKPRTRLAALVVLALFALLMVTAATQTTRNAASSARERDELIAQVDARRTSLDALDARAATLTATDAALRAGLAGRTGDSAALRRLRVSTGAVAVTGPGVTMVADDKVGADSDRDRVLDKDLQRLVNGLWAAGAEAISINGQRITDLTSIREAGATINVNYVPLQAPYTVRAIGDPDTLPARFADSTSGASWFDLVQQIGLRLQITTSRRLDLPAAERLALRYAQPAEGGSS